MLSLFSVQKFKIMIKANELRIGNLVNIKNKASGLEYKEEMVHGSLIMDLHSNGENSSFIYSPIEITEEHLVRFRFLDLSSDKNRMGYRISINSSDELCWYRQTGKVSYQTKRSGFTRDFDVKYVHELQNIYFAFTSKELPLSEA
ncbi:hypothetical protein LNI98_12230 [Tenacibaculum dicentrarchi]|nr:hypothetical protein [Tenacibaculum dicentrarchi]